MMKNKVILALLLALFLFPAIAQVAADKVETKKGAVSIQPITHGSVVLQWNKQTIYVDPYGGAAGYTGIAAPDLILITDIHGDHMDLKTLEAISTSKATFIVPLAVADKLPESYKNKVRIIKNGEKLEKSGISVTAIPMYNLPETADSRHPKGRGNGYVVNLGGKNIYFSGDTEDIAEMRALKNIDVAFVCMNLPYTMDINQAADAVLAFKPKVVYPYHYRGPDGLSDVEAFKQKVATGNKNIEVRLRNWYPAGK